MNSKRILMLTEQMDILVLIGEDEEQVLNTACTAVVCSVRKDLVVQWDMVFWFCFVLPVTYT